MSLNIAQHLRTISRFGQLASHIDSHLDDDLDLSVLAEVAGLSPQHLDREFHRYAGESPMGRVRRLRLLRAGLHIAERPGIALLDVAMDAGYGSAAAFTRAFVRSHGVPPSDWRERLRPCVPALRIEYLPEMSLQYIPFEGSRVDLRHAADELRARAMASGIERTRRFGWQVDVKANLFARDASVPINLEAALLHEPLGQRIRGLDCDRLPGGYYAVFRFQGRSPVPTEAVLSVRIMHETAWLPDYGPWLRRCRNTTFLPSFLESRFEIYVPVRRPARGEVAGASPFILER